MNKPQLILSVARSGTLEMYLDAGHGNGLTPMPLHVMTMLLERSGLYLGPRDLMEQDPQFLQIIPYIVLKQGDKYVKYTRTPAGGESRLHGKVSIGAGGHIDLIDVLHRNDSTVDVQTTLKFAALREVSEEFGLPVQEPKKTWVGLLHNFSDDVGNVHLGVVAVWDMPLDFKIESKENSQTSVELATLDELEADRPRMEKWSQHTLDYLNTIA